MLRRVWKCFVYVWWRQSHLRLQHADMQREMWIRFWIRLETCAWECVQHTHELWWVCALSLESGIGWFSVSCMWYIFYIGSNAGVTFQFKSTGLFLLAIGFCCVKIILMKRRVSKLNTRIRITKDLLHAKENDIALLAAAWSIDWTEVEIHKDIANGAYGSVHEGTLRVPYVVRARSASLDHFSLKLHEYHLYRTLSPAKKNTRKSTLECLLECSKNLTRARTQVQSRCKSYVRNGRHIGTSLFQILFLSPSGCIWSTTHKTVTWR